MARIVKRITRPAQTRVHGEWMSRLTTITEFLRANKRLDPLDEWLELHRKAGGFTGADLWHTLVAMFIAGQRGGIKGFAKNVRSFMPAVAAVLGRKRLVSPSRISDALKATDRIVKSDEVIGRLLMEGCNAHDLLRSPLAMARDGLGRLVCLFDFDPVVDAARQRAVAEAEDLPAVIRRALALMAPGHAGRKRGEVQHSMAILTHAGSGLWMHVTDWPGNTPFVEALEIAARAAAAAVKAADLPEDGAVLRFDGAGGFYAAVAAVGKHGLRALVRLAELAVLHRPDVQDYLQTARWRPVADSRSGPRREAAELGQYVLSGDQWRQASSADDCKRYRLVVSRFESQDGVKRGAGEVVGNYHYEVFVADLEPAAWPAPDVVTLYYGRCGQENSFARAKQTVHLGQIYSYTSHGQRFAIAAAMFAENVQTVLAFQAAPVGAPPPAQSPRDPEPDEAPTALPGVCTVRDLTQPPVP